MTDAQRNDGSREYEKPEVITEEVFETLALTCAKADTQCFQPEGTTVLQS